MSRFTPKLVVCLREGYTARGVWGDVLGGVTVAIIALPLAMALGIASIPINVAEQLRQISPLLTPPALGLFTAVVAGFLISALGGSRVLIGGPTGAFIVIVFNIAERHGYAGLATATLMAGVFLILMGVLRLGALIKFIPYPVTTGFTSGIAIIIASSQLKDFFGLSLVDPAGQAVPLPGEIIPKYRVLAAYAHTMDWATLAVGAGSLLLLVAMRRWTPRIPGAIVAVVASAAAVHFLGLDAADGGTVQTIGSRFGDLPKMLPPPHLPFEPGGLSWALVQDLIPSALTIAMLAGIESLLAAVVSDGMTGYRHKSDCELVAQGVANVGAAFFWGLPATGAIARTVANIKSGGKTPLAGIVHAAVLLLFMILLAPLARLVPLSTLASILIIVAWNMAEIDHFRTILRTPRSDVAVLLTTFLLTVFSDLTVAVAVGMVLASLLFMRRMSEVATVSAVRQEMSDAPPEAGSLKDVREVSAADVPRGVELFEIDGPFFFGVADRLKDTLNQFERPPRVFVLRMRRVPHIDATGLHALREFHGKCRRQGTRLLLSGVHAQPLFAFARAGFDEVVGTENMFETVEEALEEAGRVLADGTPENPSKG
ncbi:MAG: sulfate permease [Phycisphaerales bacterium]|nr:sulfate permease [Phycisphaerales bacterium]